MRPQGSPADLERRRLRAITLLQQGLLPHEVAERLGWTADRCAAGSARTVAKVEPACRPAPSPGARPI